MIFMTLMEAEHLRQYYYQVQYYNYSGYFDDFLKPKGVYFKIFFNFSFQEWKSFVNHDCHHQRKQAGNIQVTTVIFTLLILNDYLIFLTKLLKFIFHLFLHLKEVQLISLSHQQITIIYVQFYHYLHLILLLILFLLLILLKVAFLSLYLFFSYSKLNLTNFL